MKVWELNALLDQIKREQTEQRLQQRSTHR
jgi:ribosomal protein L29